MESFSEYQHFTEHDFIADPLFQDWVMRPNKEINSFWESFFEKYPDKKDMGSIAIQFLKSISFKEDTPDESIIKASFARHLDSIREKRTANIVAIPKRTKRLPVVWLAAGLTGLLVIVSALSIFYKNANQVQVTTDYSKIRNITLQDSSRVVLNANSTVRFSKNWKEEDKREIWLDGEAFFDVRHINKNTANIKTNERFIVHTNDLTIEVLGTSFNVRNRRGKTEVVLERGKIKVTFKDSKRQHIVMQPGDFISYNTTTDELISSHIAAADYSAWREKKLILIDPKVSEIIRYLEDNFGYKISLEGEGLSEKRIEGPILINNLDDALFVLSTVLNAEIVRKDLTIIIRAR